MKSKLSLVLGGEKTSFNSFAAAAEKLKEMKKNGVKKPPQFIYAGETFALSSFEQGISVFEEAEFFEKEGKKISFSQSGPCDEDESAYPNDRYSF